LYFQGEGAGRQPSPIFPHTLTQTHT